MQLLRLRFLKTEKGRHEGEIVDIPVDEALRWIRTGFAEVLPEPEPVPVKRKRGRPRKTFSVKKD